MTKGKEAANILNMDKILTNEERSKLLVQHKTERDKRIADRIKVVLLSDDNWSAEAIARALFIDDATVRRHLNSYKEEQRLKLNYKGSEPLLTKSESELLSVHFEEECYVKAKDIQAYISKVYNKSLSVPTVRLWLKNNNFKYKKPKLTPKADPELQKQFIEHYEGLLNRASIDNTPVLFGDGVHPSQQTRPAFGWIKKGKDKVIEINSARKRLNILGAINLETMKFEYQDFKTINGAATIEFLTKLESAYPKAARIDLILDNAGYNKSQEVVNFLKSSRIHVHFLPPRSPNLNPIERLWKIMHEHVSNNRVYLKFQDFKKAIFEFFDSSMPIIFDTLVSRITDNFSITQSAK
jgi:transposase